MEPPPTPRDSRAASHGRHPKSTTSRTDQATTPDTRNIEASEDLKKFDVPTLIIHGDDDQIVPIVAAAEKSSKIVKNSTLKVYPGAPHGLAQTPAYRDTFNNDLLDFIKS